MNELITTRQIQTLTDKFCRHCGVGLGDQDNFCGECGSRCRGLIEIVDPLSGTSIGHVEHEPATVIVASDGMPTINALLNNQLAVVAMIALVGPLGLPALWFSPRFAKRTKFITTSIYVLLTTVVPIAIAWYWLEYSLRPLVDVFGQ
jgi:hypothetical protein